MQSTCCAVKALLISETLKISTAILFRKIPIKIFCPSPLVLLENKPDQGWGVPSHYLMVEGVINVPHFCQDANTIKDTGLKSEV